MDETLVLILLVVVMLVGSYLAGSIPLNVNMSEVSTKHVKLSTYNKNIYNILAFAWREYRLLYVLAIGVGS